jgi:putative toxin-antitoxin system antitoxin component (TIGR02293 family)
MPPVSEATTAEAPAWEVFWQRVLSREARLGELESCTTLERVELVRAGVPAEVLIYLAEQMGISRERLYQTIGLPRSTGDRKVREGRVLDPDQGERVLGLARLIAQVERIVEESGDTEGFDAAGWVAQWLEDPLPALGGRRPGDLMDTAEGRSLVSNLIGQIQAASYA